MNDGPKPTAVENIAAVIRIEQQAEQHRALGKRAGDAVGGFAGTMLFVMLHLVWFALWATWNAGVLGMQPFDPFPYQLLAVIVSLEGVLLTTFVLIKQNNMSRMSDRRAQLDLQINLLTEKEVTKVIQMLERISAHLNIEADVVDEEAREMGEVTAVDNIARELEERLPEED